MAKILDVKKLVVNYGAIKAVKGIDIAVEEGQIVALLGANGAGKTSTLKAISGMIKPSGGQVLLAGKNVAGKRAYAIARSGISQSPEGRLILIGLTVEENLRVGAYGLKPIRTVDENGKRKVISVRTQIAENMAKVFELFPILEERKKQQASTLSGGEQQMLAIARALMASPKILLLDEPSLGLAPLIIKDIFTTLKKIQASGTSILIVEQNALATLKIADYAYVLELGTISMQGPASELIHDDRLVAAYLGGKQ